MRTRIVGIAVAVCAAVFFQWVGYIAGYQRGQADERAWRPVQIDGEVSMTVPHQVPVEEPE